MKLLKTKIQRLFGLTLVALIAAFVIHGILNTNEIHPEESFFITVDNDNVDINSPTKMQIIAERHIKYDNYYETCSSHENKTAETFFQNDLKLIIEKYRNIALCNSANLKNEKLKTAQDYFKNRVDALYEAYYLKWAENITANAIYALFAWLALILIYRVYSWIKAGE